MKKPVASRADVLPILGEVFRAHGYEGTSLALITKATGLGKGSLYNYFPGGKQQMAAEVLAEIDEWFEVNVFAPLRAAPALTPAITAMIENTDRYFRSGGRVCLVGVFALAATRDEFSVEVNDYFARWHDALAALLRRSGLSAGDARRRSEDAMLSIQGALVLARARDDVKIFSRAMAALRQRLLA